MSAHKNSHPGGPVSKDLSKRYKRQSRHFVACRRAVVCLFIVSSAVAQAGLQFEDANQAYAQGHFRQAIDGYENLVRSRQWSANLFYDLGNAYFRVGDFGRAILNYERALALERHHPEALANLQIARDEAHALELQPGAVERYIRFASVDQYSIAAITVFWIGIFCLVALIFARRRSLTAKASVFVAFLVCAAAMFAIWQLQRGAHGCGRAIVTADSVQARIATADTANSVLALPQGSEVRVLSTRGDWVYASLPNDLRGWIPAKSTEQVRL